MKDLEQKEIIAMLAVIYKKLDTLDRKVNNRGHLSATIQHYIDDLKREAAKINDQIEE